MVVLQLIRRFYLETATLAQFLLYVAGSEFPCWGRCVGHAELGTREWGSTSSFHLAQKVEGFPTWAQDSGS